MSIRRNFLIIIFLFSFILFSSDEFLDKVNLGLNYLKIGNYEDAISYFKQAKNLSPDNAIVYYYLGEAYFRKGDMEEAKRYYDQAIEREPQNPDFHYSLAHLYLAQNDKAKALEEFNKVIEISPQSLIGKNANLVKKQIEKGIKEKDISDKWVKLEEEERKKIEEEKKKKEAGKEQQGQPGMPGQEGMPGFEGIPGEKEEKIPIDQLLKRIKYGTKTLRENESRKLPYYSSSEISGVYNEIIGIIKKEKDIEVKKNLISALGKVNQPDVGEFLLSLIQNKETPFEIKIVALESIGGIKTESVMVTLRDTLNNMIKNREQEREEAKKNIQNINNEIEKLEIERITLNSELNKLQQDRSDISNKLQMGGMDLGMMAPGGGMPPVQGGGEIKVLSTTEVKKLRDQLKNIDTQIGTKTERLNEIQTQLQQLQEKSNKYQMLLAKKGGEVKISAPSYSPQFTPGVFPPGMGPGFMPEYTPQQQKTTEEENEIIFAMKLIIALGEMRDKQALPIIKNAWKEFGASNYEPYYSLALAQLGDYSKIDLLLERLQQDYPQQEQEKNDEIKLRAGIIKVLPDYLKTNPNEEIIGLINYLSENAQYPEISKAASEVLISLQTKGK